jgi:1-acyl-sn-glycerol-3-phosphate acyltransferase
MIFRVLFFLFVLVPYLIVTIPYQIVASRFGLPGWNGIPKVFHKLGAAFLGLRVTVAGTPVENRPVLIVSNHISWTDIVAIGSVADVTFVAKQEVKKWFFVGFLADLQRTVYVDRTRRSDAGRTTREMARRMASGAAVLLFAEGQSDIGTHVLPFRSALIGAAQHAMVEAGAKEVLIQPLTVAYTRLQGLPVSRNDRSLIAWIKSKSFKQNITEILTGGVKEVTVAFGTPRPLAEGVNRKTLTREAENEVRRMLVALNRGLPLPEPAPSKVAAASVRLEPVPDRQ